MFVVAEDLVGGAIIELGERRDAPGYPADLLDQVLTPRRSPDALQTLAHGDLDRLSDRLACRRGELTHQPVRLRVLDVQRHVEEDYQADSSMPRQLAARSDSG